MANVSIFSRALVGVVRRPPARNLSAEGPSPQGEPLSAPAPDLCTLRAARLAALHTTVVVERGSIVSAGDPTLVRLGSPASARQAAPSEPLSELRCTLVHNSVEPWTTRWVVVWAVGDLQCGLTAAVARRHLKGAGTLREIDKDQKRGAPRAPTGCSAYVYAARGTRARMTNAQPGILDDPLCRGP
jgi:hypothetical protein